MSNPPLMPHQQKAVKDLRNGNILKGGVGSGKTRTGLAYYCDRYGPFKKLYVITTAKKRDTGDWQHEAALWGVDVVVDSWNNLPSYENVEGACFLFDEQRVVGKGVWVKAFQKVTRRNKWILLSATPGDTWLDYIPVFVANGFYSSRTEFLREHVIFSRFSKYPKVERIVGSRRLAELLSTILVTMPFERHTTRHEIDVYVDYDTDLFKRIWKDRWNPVEERPIQHVAELFVLMRWAVNIHESRLERIRDLLVEHPRMIIFYNFDYELEILRTLEVTKAEWNGHKHEPLPDGPEWVYLTQYLAGAEGWNCVETDAVVFYSASYSYRQTEQAKGRIDRLDTPFTDLWYYVLRSSSLIDSAIFKALSNKHDFNLKQGLKEMMKS
jgi:hypothetical protein